MITKRRRFNVSDVVNSTFYQVPKFLFCEEFKGLNSDARLLYGMLKDRHELSIKNKWLTDEGDVYLIYTREEMMKMLGVSDKTIKKAMDKLKEFGLLEEIRQGLRKPNLIFMYMVDDYKIKPFKDVVDDSSGDEDKEKDAENPLKSEKISEPENFRLKNRNNYDSRTGEFPIQEPENFRPIYTDSNQSIFNETDLSNTENLSINLEDKTKEDGLMDNITSLEPLVKENIGYNDLIHVYKFRTDEINEIVKIILSQFLNDDNELIRINGKPLLAKYVKHRMLELRYEHIQYVFDSLDNVTHEIKNIRSYLTTTLYNAPETMGNYYNNKANTILSN